MQFGSAREASRIPADMSRGSERRTRRIFGKIARDSPWCNYNNNCVMILLIGLTITATSILSTIERVNADTETIKLNEGNVDKNLNFNVTKTKTIVEAQLQKNQTSSPIATEVNSEDHKRQSLDLIVDDDSSHRFWTIADHRNDERHAYNVSYERHNSSSPLNLIVPLPKEGRDENITNHTKTDNNGDDLSVADSRFIPKSASSRFDEDVEIIDDQGAILAEDSPDSPQSSSSSYDSSSSNLSEQKVVKELTKILSKGISSATDQVGLDTLENWKRRQRKRKAIKDNRAKLFEDLLNAAIVSHPEKSTKKRTTSSRKTSGSKSEASFKQNSFAQSTGLLGNANIDPDMAIDAENVIQHLQGLATFIDGKSSSSLGSLGLGSSGAGGVGDDNSQVQADEATSYGSGTSEEPNESSSANQSDFDGGSDEIAVKAKKINDSGSDRPLVRQFKKIRKQFSQRRKQLDQIKKIFNVDLALNPKDGSLMGKLTNSKKNNSGSTANFDDEESAAAAVTTTATNSKKKANSKAKLRDLMQYLKKNPQILASVMSELTIDSDPSQSNSSSGASLVDSDESGGNQYQSLSMGSYDSVSGPSREYDHDNIDGIDSSDKATEPALLPKHKRSNSRSSTQSQFINNNRQSHISRTSSPDTLDSRLMKPLAGVNKAKSAEALLLASLRERQLMNLARLEMVLAERQAASDRSQVFSSLLRQPDRQDNAGTGSQQPRNAVSDYTSSTSATTSTTAAPAQQSRYNDSSHDKSYASGKAEVHHFVVTNLSNQHIDPQQLIRQANNATSSHQSPYNQVTHSYSSPALAKRPSLYNDQQNSTPQMQIIHHPTKQLQPPHSTYQMSVPSGSHLFSYQLQQQLNNNQNSAHRQQNNQQHSNSLNRFRDWRDVSHSETDLSQRSDNIIPRNITWSPYDLNTGSTSQAVAAERSSPNDWTSNSYRAQSSNQRIQSVPNTDHKVDSEAKRDMVDSSITRPGNQARQSAYQDQPSNEPAISNELENSSYMTKSGSTDPGFASADKSLDLTKADPEIMDDDEGQAANDDLDQLPRMSPIARQPTHVDYFSAYKRDWEDKRARRKRRHNTMSGSVDSNENKNQPDPDGAIWAS